MMSIFFRRLGRQAFQMSHALRQPTVYLPCSNNTSKRPELIKILWSNMIHTTPKRQAVPPIILLVLRPVAKFSAMLFGRFIRKWWQRLPASEREKFISRVKGKKTQIAFGATIVTGFGFIFYLEHIEEEPLTNRKRFMLYNNEQMLSIAQLEFENQVAEHRTEIVPPSHPLYNRVIRVANRILNANKHLEQIQKMNWAVTVIDRPDVINAFVLPHGKIMVFTGILNIASNDDQLAIILGHEMSHAILNHMREALSKSIIYETIFLIPLILLWALLPDAAALFSQWMSSLLADVIIHLPFNRATEKEADVIGLTLAAKACYDVREAPVFWAKMAQLTESEEEPIEWLSTHPSSESRQLELSQLIPEALGIRDSCLCPRLPPISRTQLMYNKAS